MKSQNLVGDCDKRDDGKPSASGKDPQLRYSPGAPRMSGTVVPEIAFAISPPLGESLTAAPGPSNAFAVAEVEAGGGASFPL